MLEGVAQFLCDNRVVQLILGSFDCDENKKAACSVELCYFCVQQLRKMATDRSYWDMYEAYVGRSTFREMFFSTLNNMTSEFNFDSVKSCLAMGPGDGCLDVRFIKKCTPNITKFIAIEQDHESAERLKVHLRKSLPDVEGLVIESDFKGWKGPSNPVDLVMAFHVLYPKYYSGSDERRILLKNVHDCWLTDGGFLVVLSSAPSLAKSPQNTFEIFARLGTPVTPWEDIEADILDVGLIKQCAYDIRFTRDYSNPDDDFLRYHQLKSDQPITLDDVRRLMEELYPDGKPEGFHTFAVYKKAL